MSLTEVVAELPALSVAVPGTLWSAPSPRCWGGVRVSMPERPSCASKETVTPSRYQPSALAARSGLPEMLGAVLSMLTDAVVEAELPALSLAVPLTAWSLPSVAMVCGSVQSFSPDRAVWSAHENETDTLVLFQPFVLRAGDWLDSIVGADRSIRTVVDCGFSVFPALSTDQYLIV